jgi:hypothetical protein
VSGEPPITRAQSTESWGCQEPNQLIPVDPDQPIRYALVYQPPGELVGALWVGERRALGGFVPVSGCGAETALVWRRRMIEALRAVGHCRDAFEYWRRGNGVTWEGGPVGKARDVQELRRRLG